MAVTIFGVERRAFILGATFDFIVYRFGGFLLALAVFVVYWLACYWITKRDPALFSILPRIPLQRRVYCPFLLTNKRRAF
jgi:type IV secretory pathway VirB3-like protein